MSGGASSHHGGGWSHHVSLLREAGSSLQHLGDWPREHSLCQALMQLPDDWIAGSTFWVCGPEGWLRSSPADEGWVRTAPPRSLLH